MILQAFVKKQGHIPINARDGQEAVELFESERPDIVLLDALMPVMDGFEAARVIKGLAGENMIPIIFLTSLQDADSLARCLDVGGDDFLSKPYNRVILQAKITAFNRMRLLHSTVQAQRDQIVLHNEQLMHEQEVAKKVFDNIAHPGCLQASNINYLVSPMAVFNGDVLLAARKPSGGMLVFLGDFTGHGLPAAIGAMPTSEIFYGMALKGFSMQDILKEINNKLKKILPVGVFCCGCMVDISFRKEIAEVWNGGLPDCFMYRAEDRDSEPMPSFHLPLGVLGGISFSAETHLYEMKHGDRIFLWSDGIHEEMDENEVMFGNERLMEVFEENQDPALVFDELQQAVRDFTGSTLQGDDHSIVEIQSVPEDGLIENVSGYAADYKSGPKDWQFTFRLGASSLKSFNPLPLMIHILMEVPGLRAHSGKIYTILSELFNNALEHGVMGLSSELKSSSAGFAEYYQKRQDFLQTLDDCFVEFELDHKPLECGGILKMVVRDSGKGFEYNNKTNVKKAALNKSETYCGRGIPLVKTLCRSVQHSEGGRAVEVVFEWRIEG
ncbi:MAG: fused response regulator/phosphatase [Moraxellaceae bacterium]|nr:MAG: fused response regulator/phosphatase [Moraxellaceae bacterium]